MKYKAGRGSFRTLCRTRSGIGSESSAFDFCEFLKALDAETILKQVQDRAQHDLSTSEY